jgi:hypothetical protein
MQKMLQKIQKIAAEEKRTWAKLKFFRVINSSLAILKTTTATAAT